MRFFWLQYGSNKNVEHIPGVDFFTKALPRTKYDQFHRYIVVNTDFSEEKRPKEWKL
jgi:hypothetical protein